MPRLRRSDESMNRTKERVVLLVAVLAALAAWAHPAAARFRDTDPEAEGIRILEQDFQVGPYAPAPGSARLAKPMAIPDIFGPGAVLNVGNVLMKVTNYGICGNPFTNLSSDPSGQWPGASSVEYLNFLGLLVGAKNPFATDPTALRRVSYFPEWRPPSLDPEDRMYRAYDGIANGSRYINDDDDKDPKTGDPLIDEDFLDGRDNDGDGKIDEDFAAIGQQMYTCVMRDDTPQAINAAAAERHVPLGLEVRQSAWAYSIPGYTDFDVIQYEIYNRSGHTLDSVVVGFLTDLDCGPVNLASYWADDHDLPQYPFGDFIVKTSSSDLRLQPPNDHKRDVAGVSNDSSLCARYHVRVTGWTVADADGDLGKTPGVGSILLIDHTIDPTGETGPSRVGLRAFRSYPGGTPYTSGGAPTIDQQRYEFMTSNENIDPVTGFITKDPGEENGDYRMLVSVGPWLGLADGEHVSVTLAFAVSLGSFKLGLGYPGDYTRAVDPTSGGTVWPASVTNGAALLAKYPTLENALSAQVAFEGAYEVKSWPYLTDDHGRETPLKAPPGVIYNKQGCPAHDTDPRQVNDRGYTWFDFDCDYCTGAYSVSRGGLFHRTWLAEAPPPSPATNLTVGYNYTDNPDRRFVPTQDHKVLLAWNNLSEVTPDPKSGQFDFRGYKIWKVSDWQRPVGAGGPFEDDWTLLAEYRLFDQRATNAIRPCPPESIGPGLPCPAGTAPGDTLWPQVYIPQLQETRTIKLHAGDLWDKQSGDILHADLTVPCLNFPVCKTIDGISLGGGSRVTRTYYPVGRYHYTDSNVKNGFIYFYSVTAFDSTGSQGQKTELNSRRSAVEAEGIVPQASADSVHGGANVWVVPNPYRGYRRINDRPSSWDLTPNASDPTGTHIDFLGLPRGHWHIKIFTVSGDLVAEIDSKDAVNESVRSLQVDDQGRSHPGYNRQADNPNDGQARWNLISRNGQDVVSGIYLFTVELGGSVKHRGKFVIIR
jgi:hypothetical protein